MNYDKLVKTGKYGSSHYFRGELGNYRLSEADRPGMAYYIMRDGQYLTGLFPTTMTGFYSGDIKKGTGKIYLTFAIQLDFSETTIEQS